MVDIIKTYSVGDLDTDGNAYVGSDKVTAVYHYVSSGEAWTKDYTDFVNPFVNHDFTYTTITGSPGADGRRWYETGDDYEDVGKTDGSRRYKISTVPYNFREEILNKAILLEASPYTMNSPEAVNTEYFIQGDIGALDNNPPKHKFPKHYNGTSYVQTSTDYNSSGPWVTSSGVTNDAFCSWTLEEPTYVSSFYVDGYGSVAFDINTAQQDIYDRSIGYFEIQVTSSGTGLDAGDYTTVYSEYTDWYVDPKLRTLTSPVLAKHVKIVFRSKSNTSPGTSLNKVQLYTKDVVDEGVLLLVHGRYNSSGLLQMNQDVDLTGSEHIYFNLVNYHTNTNYYPTVFIDNDEIRTYDNLEDAAVGSNAANFQNVTRWGVSIDVSSYTGNHTFKIQRNASAEGGNQMYFMLGDVTNIAPWFNEPSSSARGQKKSFPEKCNIIADTEGLSILDEDTQKLWMRFELGVLKMLQMLPRVIKAKDGVIYLGTSNGVMVIDFPDNKAWILDGTGLRERFGIDRRNEIAFDRWNLTEWFTQEYVRGKYSMYAYNYFEQTPSLAWSCIDDLYVGYDYTYGDFILLATPLGLAVHKGKIGDSSAAIYYSKNQLPVSKIFYDARKIWYVQGKGPAARLKYIDSINDIDETDFSQSGEINSLVQEEDDLSSLDSSFWETYNRDESMVLVNSAGVLTISGTHTQGGKTGIETRQYYPDRSFVVTAKVKIKQFPPNARGGFRLGYSFNHAGDGILSGNSSAAAPSRQGIYISAHNIDPYGTPVPESATMSGQDKSLGQGWMYVQHNIGGFAGVQYAFPGETTDNGFKFFLDSYSASFTTGATSSPSYMPRINQSFSFPKRDFSVRAKVQLAGGFSSEENQWYENAALYLGISAHNQVVPNTAGTYTDNDYLLDSGLCVAAHTAFSGIAVYVTGRVAYNGTFTSIVFDENSIPTLPSENTGTITSPFRDWRVDYSKDNNTISVFLDGQYIGTRDVVTDARFIGVVFGTNTARGASHSDPDTESYIKDLQVYLPEVSAHSSYKYGLEISDTDGIVSPVFSPPVTFSGIHLVSDVTPSSGTLTYLPSLWDGDFTSLSAVVQQDYSLGFELPFSSVVDTIRIYDVATETDGWQNYNDKRLELWYSEDNLLWTKHRTLNLARELRVAGVTDLKLNPSVSGTYFKLTPTNASYLVGGNTAFSVAEIQPLMASGIGFYGQDGTTQSEFREWKLIYDAATKETTGYIDGIEVSKGVAPEFSNGGKFVISHDLTVVSSGTHSDFDAQVKDFKVTFGDNLDLGEGSLNHVSVSSPTISGTYENYTIVSTTASGLYILDKDFDSTPMPDRKLFLNGDESPQGSYKDASITIFENGLERGQGLLFVGTNRADRNVPEVEIVSTRPWWLDAQQDRVGAQSRMRYGNRGSLIYMANINKYMVMFDDNAAYMLVTDLRTGESEQLQRYSWLWEGHQRGSGFDYHISDVKGVYIDRLSTLWHWAAGITVAELDPITSKVTSPGIFEEVDQSGSRSKFVVYVIHNNVFYFGRNELRGVDVLTGQNAKIPRHQTTPLTSSLTRLRYMSWGSGDFGEYDAVYSDFDRHIYFLGKGTTDFDSGKTYFIKYNPDNGYNKVLNTFSNVEVDWPYSDEDVQMNQCSNPSTSRLVYNPIDRKIYHIATRGPRPVLNAFDVTAQRWEDTGSPPPYITSKEWPYRIVMTSAGTNHAYQTNYACYDLHEEAIVFATGASYLNTDKFFIYTPSVDETAPSFDYQPARDGLTTTSGQHYHFTSNTIGTNLNEDSDYYVKDFDWQGSYSAIEHHHSVYSEEVNITVFSGTGQNSTLNFGHSSHGAAGLVESSTSRDALAAVGDFEVHFDFSMPSFDLSVYGTNNFEGPPRVEFFISVSDGYGQPWIYDWESFHGFESTAVHQIVSARMGIVGDTSNDSSDQDFKAYLRWVDGFNDGVNSTTEYSHNRMYGQDTYESSTVDLVSAFSEFKHGHLTYDYETDTVEYFVDGVSTGSYKLRRKFDTTYGLYLSTGYSTRMDSSNNTSKEWVVKLKNLSFKRKSFDSIKDGRLLTVVSGSYGEHLHERTDSTLNRTRDWVYQCDMYLPSSFRYQGYEYIATLGAMEDDYKTAELVAYVSKTNKKSIGITGDLSRRDDSSTYLGSTEHQWDDIDIGHYRMEKNTASGTVSLYVNNQEAPSIVVDYEALPTGGTQRMFYGKASYGDWERVYTEPVKSGAWSSNFTLTGYGTAQDVEKMTIDDSAYFALIDQGSAGTATFTLDEGLGTVDVYAFFLSQGYDLAIDTPHVVTASEVVSLPVAVGPTGPITSVQQNTDENGAYSEFKTLLRVNQTRDFEGTLSSTDAAQAQTSGWVHLGRYNNPTSVKVTASGTVGTASTIGFVSADAIGIDIGKYGHSKVALSTGRVRYNTGTTSFYDDVTRKSGFTVIDTTDGKVIASFGEETPDQLKSGDIIGGSKIG